MSTVYLRTSRHLLRDAIISVVRSLSGREATHADAARTVHTAIGLAALYDIKDDFVRKAKGEVGEDGNRWPRLSPKTLAYGRRFGPGEKSALKKAAGLGPGNRNRGLLSAAQDKRWRAIFATSLKRLAISMDISSAKARAAQIAWTVLKREGAKTKLEVFGTREHEILRDTGVLLNSLSPGEINYAGGNYNPPADQIFNLIESGVIVGTNVPYAKTHNRGDQKRGIPKREFLPRQVPDVWKQRWARVANQAISGIVQSVLRSGGAA